jgi:hypothetical protein
MEKNELKISYFFHEGEMSRMERIARMFAVVAVVSMLVTLAVVVFCR